MIKPEVVNQLNSIHELQLLMYLIQMEEYGMKEWKNTKENRKILGDHLSIAGITVKVALRRLVDKEFITKVRRAVYKINKDICQN